MNQQLETAARLKAAATIILIRQGADGPEVLMGQRGADAAFMPNKFVFPGGALDADDAAVALAGTPEARCLARLDAHPASGAPATAHGLVAAAIRELWEETGLALGRPGQWAGEVPPAWADFAARGLVPDGSALRFVFRAITPIGRSRRFDARFLLADATAICGDADDFTLAQDELSHLQWVALHKARGFDLPFITEVVLAEIGQHMKDPGLDEGVPFFDNSTMQPVFRRLV